MEFKVGQKIVFEKKPKKIESKKIKDKILDEDLEMKDGMIYSYSVEKDIIYEIAKIIEVDDKKIYKLYMNDEKTDIGYAIIENKNVKILPELYDRVIYQGDRGIVKTMPKEPLTGYNAKGATITYGIDFDDYRPHRHNLSGLTRQGYGWYCDFCDIELIEEEEEKKPEQTQIIVDDITADTPTANDLTKLTKEISKLTKEIHKKERMQDLLNEAIIEKGKDIAIEDLKEKLKSELDKFIEEKYGILPKVIEIRTESEKKKMTGIFHKDFEKICGIVNSDIPLMLTGGAGAGKNYTLEQVAEALNLDFYFSNAVNQEYKLTGFIDANGTYHETEFYKAFTKGGMFFLDEIDASCPECLVILNSAIANRYFDFPTGRVKAHKKFRVVCAGNTYGTGADMIYVGRNVLDGATLDRFVVLQFDYDENVERQLAFDEELFNFIRELRKAINDANLRYIVSMRAIINSTKLLQLGIDKLTILKTTIIKNMQKDDLNVIIQKLRERLNSDWVEELRKMCD